VARFVLDTNTVSQILRRNATVLGHLEQAADGGDDLYMCQPHDDADLLIAAFTRRLRATVVTNNAADFADLGVPVVDWTVA